MVQGRPPAYPPQAQGPGVNALGARLDQMGRNIDSLFEKFDVMQEQGGVRFPEQFKMGVIRYPYLFPRPFVWVSQVLEKGKDPYATSLTLATAQFQYTNIYSFLNRLSFSLVRTAAPEGSPLPINTWLPLSCSKDTPFVQAGQVYIGKDFKYRIQSDTEGTQWGNNSDFRTSKEADSIDGYVLPTEYQTVPNDTINIEVAALEVAQEGEVFELYAVFHGYKMVTKSEGYNAIS